MVIRKIIGIRKQLASLQNGREWIEAPSFSIQKVYKALMGEVHKTPWAKLMCQTTVPAKYKFVVWMAMHERLATCSYLRRIGIQVDHACCFCSREEETMDHLFFGCEFSRDVWRKVAVMGGVYSDAAQWHEGRRLLEAHCTNSNGKQRVYRSMVCVLIYHIWKERNGRRMKGSVNSADVIANQCMFMLAWCGLKDKKVGRFLQCVG